MARRRRKQTNTQTKQAPQTKPDIVIDKSKLNRYNWLTIAGLTVLLVIVYMTTMLPGVSEGDSAELQYCSKLLGVCHSPGYQIECSFGKLFSMLPIGPDVAWRINFMMVFFGIAGSLSLYGAVRRITGFIIPAFVAATTLAFSSIYWTHSLVAEAYVFYSSFLLMGIYTFVRYIQDQKFWWLYLTALTVGVCISDRASELFVMPGFLFALLFAIKKIKWNLFTAMHFAIAILIFVLPFVYTMSYYFARTNQDYLYGRDSKIRNRILSKWGYTEFKPPKVTKRYVKAIAKTRLGLSYSKNAKFDKKVMHADIDKYTWLLSGAGGFKDRYEQNSPMLLHQGRGSSIGLLGLLLAAASIVLWRKHYGWASLGLWFFIGNLIFILWHHRWDNLTFIVPGLIGLSLLAGLGSVGPAKWNRQKRRYILQACCLVAPLFLLLTNYSRLDMSTEQTAKTLEYNHKIAAANWPKDSAFIGSCWPAMTLRYLFYVEADRPDIHVLYEDDRPDWPKLIDHFAKRGQPVFMRARYLGKISDQQKKYYAARTQREFLQLGFVRVDNKEIAR